ncbi:SagB/ThcOx family dehydrogenase [Streptomyces sp. NBC_00233]|uniref:SagB/ThcOx family dehydrogenase n=1 Tax=Streptomyces sp. NBC_00233 TaxID=2975686 RepID=UPI00225C3D67|nr:SagB/ThcOx family dehydrogenase [Streptomyces sp. NBC_00233]MCX5232606.1 SagB/ThcOx family dehydrogenase [Streptomyces sp. NBC_00233]
MWADSAAALFHRLSSFGWFEEPAPSATGARPLPAVPPPAGEGHLVSLAHVLAARCSRRDFDGSPLSPEALTVLLWSGYGRAGTHRAVIPSCGGLLSLRLMVLALRVPGLAAGSAYPFLPDTLSLGPPMPARPPQQLFHTRHIEYERAAAVIFIVGDPRPPIDRYGDRGYRYALLEAGHAAQNLCLAATAMRLGTVTVGGFDDEAVGAAFDLDHEVPYYAVAVGGTGHELPEEEMATVLALASGSAMRPVPGKAAEGLPGPCP